MQTKSLKSPPSCLQDGPLNVGFVEFIDFQCTYLFSLIKYLLKINEFGLFGRYTRIYS